MILSVRRLPSVTSAREPEPPERVRSPMTFQLSPTDERDGRALALFARWESWQPGHTKDGRSFFAIPGSEPNLYHMVDCRECSCKDFQISRNTCKHVRACRLWMAAFRTGAVTLKSRPTTPAVTDDTGTGDDLVFLTPEGAAYLAEQIEQRAATLTTYERLYPTCGQAGCQDDPEPRSSYCYRHQLVDAF